MTVLRYLFTPILALIVMAGSAFAQTPLVVDVTEGTLDPTPIAIPDFIGEDNREAEIGADISRVISNNLDTSGLFAPVDPEAFIEDITDINLRPRFGDFLGDISIAGQRFTYPLNLTIANAFVADRLALIGDAAHGMHPIAGQGLNAGLRDVAALAHVIDHATIRGEDFASPQVLGRYQSWRRFDTAALAASTDLFNRLFSNDNPLLRFARDAGMAAINGLPGLRRGVIREAAGITGELPDLMRG